jgi:hypothetical protein
VSDEQEFAILAASLRDQGFGKRLFMLGRLRRGLSLAGLALGLLAVAVLLALTNTMSIVITLTIVSMILFEVVLIGFREHRREAVQHTA